MLCYYTQWVSKPNSSVVGNAKQQRFNRLQGMQSGDTIQAKQTYLRSQIIDAGVDPESFMVFMGAAKGEGENINLEVWTLPELKKVVQEFKQSLEQELKRQQTQQSKLSGSEALIRNRSSRQVADRVMGSQLPKKEKVFYERDDLWDYEMTDKVECRKTHHFFNFKIYPEINCKGVEVKKGGGYFFGIVGGKHYIQLTLTPNFSNAPIVRKSEDVDWLRTMLTSQYPGSYIPPLEPTPQFQNEDKAAVSKRTRQILQFLNSLVHFDHLLNSKYTHMFFTEPDYKVFENFKSKNAEIQGVRGIGAMESFDGVLPVQISQRMQELVKNSAKYGKEVVSIFKSVEETLGKLNNDYNSMTRHFGILHNDFGKLREKYVALAQKSGFDKIEMDTQFDKKLSAVFGHLKNVFSALQAHTKKQAYFIRDFNEDNIKAMIRQWNEFDVLEKRHKRELDAYLTLKSSLSKRKQQFFLDLSKKELEEREKTGISKQTTLAQKQQMYKLKFPTDSKLEQQKRAYQGYINHMYQKSFLTLLSTHEKQLQRKLTKLHPILMGMLNQRIQIYGGFEKYLQEESGKLGFEVLGGKK